MRRSHGPHHPRAGGGERRPRGPARSGRPRALIRTDRVEVVPFDQVDAEHAWLEGEGDRSLEHWREAHRRFFAEQATHAYGVSDVMPVVLERFELLYSA